MSDSGVKGLVRVYEWLERAIVIGLLVLLMVVVLWASVFLGVAIVQSMYERIVLGQTLDHSPLAVMLERTHMLHDVFGAFLLILIGIELMKTVVVYLSEHEMHVETVFTVAMIAVARHAIDLDLKAMSGIDMLGMAALVITLALAYHLFRRAQLPGLRGEKSPSPPAS